MFINKHAKFNKMNLVYLQALKTNFFDNGCGIEKFIPFP